MINDLLLAMSSDMNIDQFDGETEDSFIYRLCYSALGQWCLRIAQNSADSTVGTTKHNQTIVLNEKLVRFLELFPAIAGMFINVNKLRQQTKFTVHIRKVYEETGYLLTKDNNRNHIANYGRSITINDKALFFGLPITKYTVSGLGIFSYPTKYRVSSKEFMIRDDLTYKEFFHSQFDSIDFQDRDINSDELEFFNPKSHKVPSLSWEKQMKVDCTIARKSKNGPFYRVMYISDKLQFIDELIEQQNDNFTSYEYRRLYFALKAYYGNPHKARIVKIDENYSRIRIEGHLPNREYYYLLLLSWPENSGFDKTNFIIQNDLLSEVITMLRGIGIKIKGGFTNEE